MVFNLVAVMFMATATVAYLGSLSIAAYIRRVLYTKPIVSAYFVVPPFSMALLKFISYLVSYAQEAYVQ